MILPASDSKRIARAVGDEGAQERKASGGGYSAGAGINAISEAAAFCRAVDMVGCGCIG